MRFAREGPGEAKCISQPLAIFPGLPEDVAPASMLVERARNHKQQVGKTVQVFFRHRAGFFFLTQPDDISFCAPAYRASQMTS